MPAPKKAGSARAAKPTTNKDGSARKKPGPAKGTPRGQKSVAASATTVDTGTTTPRPRRSPKKKKTFLLYAVDGHELSFVAEQEGATGTIAVTNAVKAGVVAPETPIVPLAPRFVERVVEIEAVPREVQYKVKAAKKTTRRKAVTAEVVPPTPEEGAGEPVVATPPAAPKSSARGGNKAAAAAAAPAPPAPGATTANPFAD